MGIEARFLKKLPSFNGIKNVKTDAMDLRKRPNFPAIESSSVHTKQSKPLKGLQVLEIELQRCIFLASENSDWTSFLV